MKKIYLSIFLLVLMFLTTTAQKTVSLSSSCPPTSAQVDLAVNNVRAHLLVGGDLWWDPSNNSNGMYEVPIGSGISPIYAGSFWIGGIDGSGQLRVAAQTYRQSGANDFWAGPISKDVSGTLSITPSRCNQFDRFWKINKLDVQNFVTGGAATADMISWPGNGDVANNELPNLAPFFDSNNDGIYDYLAGDYPYFNLSGGGGGGNCNNYLYGDQAIWWVFNDIGNAKTETNSDAIGVEVRAQAFAYSSTNKSINNTTFYKYEIVNRSNDSLMDTYTGIWCDVDLGAATDDFVGCDVGLNLGYVYNGRDTDSFYGANPPALGIKFLQGPFADPMDALDNDHNNTIDELNEECLLTKFMTYVNANSIPTGIPNLTDDYYDYLSGKWLDGQTITYGGTGRGGGIGATTNPCSYMFPGTSDITSPGAADWTMPNSGIQPDDMRFLMSEGKFSMAPGSVNYMTDAVIYARANSGGPLGSLSELKLAAADIQTFFNTCFTTVGLSELSSNNEITCFPNPFNDNVNIVIPNFNNQEFELKLFDMRGKVITPQYSQKDNTISFNDKNLKAGTYVVAIKMKNGKSYSKKIVKM